MFKSQNNFQKLLSFKPLYNNILKDVYQAPKTWPNYSASRCLLIPVSLWPDSLSLSQGIACGGRGGIWVITPNYKFSNYWIWWWCIYAYVCVCLCFCVYFCVWFCSFFYVFFCVNFGVFFFEPFCECFCVCFCVCFFVRFGVCFFLSLRIFLRIA